MEVPRITETLLLPEDVLIFPVSDLPEDVRAAIDCEDEDFAVSRPGARSPSTVVDPDLADLLGRFREPRTVVEAVLLFSRERGVPPQEVLSGAYPLVRRFVDSRFLVAGGADTPPPTPAAATTLELGRRIGEFRIVRPVAVLEDTEIHRVRRGDGTVAALKIEREPGSHVRPLFDREASLLGHLDGKVAPRLLDRGEEEGRTWLLLEWCPGVDAESAAAEIRESGADPGSHLLELGRRIARAYGRLHEAGVLHGDVHPRNLLVDGDGRVRIVDLGFGVRTTDAGAGPVRRGGVPFFMEPESAVAQREGRPPPPPTASGEQYALAALLYRLVTGLHTVDFSLDRERMLRQIAEDPPLPFAERDRPSWPALEAVLGRALSKEPERRYPTVTAFAAALDAVQAPAPAPVSRRAPDPLSARAEHILQRLRPEGPVYRGDPGSPPTASVNFGAAGVAVALYRSALLREDASLLAAADAWAELAARRIGGEGAFRAPDRDLTPETVGTASPYHAASGVHLVRALVARAAGEPGRAATAAAAYLDSSAHGALGRDLTLGTCSTLLGTTLLLESLRSVEGIDVGPLLERGDALLDGLWTGLADEPPVPESTVDNLGIAHGWAGFLYASLRWSAATGRAVPAALGGRLEELAALAEPHGRGSLWPWIRGGPTWMPGWCNGSAGHALLWILAARDVDPRFGELAVQAAWNAWEAPDGAASLCCGLAGRAYALLALHRWTGDGRWLERARVLGRRAAEGGAFEPDTPLSLAKGELVLPVLEADLARPDAAALPLFEEEGWPAG